MVGVGVLPFRPRCHHILDRQDERGVGDDAQLAADVGRPLGEHPGAVSRPRLGHHLSGRLALSPAEPLDPDLLADQVQERPDLQLVIPGVQRAHAGCLAHPVPILAHTRNDDGAPISRGEAAVAAHDLEARREAFDVPLPRSGEGLVEIVDVEDHPSLGRAEQPEVGQVSVAAELNDDPGPGSGGQVGRHDHRGPPIEGERGDHHPPAAEGDVLGDPGLGLLLEQRDGIGAPRRRLPPTVARPRGPRAGGPPPRHPLLHGEVLAPPGRGEPRIGPNLGVRSPRSACSCSGGPVRWGPRFHDASPVDVAKRFDRSWLMPGALVRA